jgi:sugar phosphate isomerase/epimerase
MFRLAVFTDEISQDFQRAADVAREFSLHGLEVRSVWDTPPQDLSDEQVARMRGILKGTGLTVCSIASPFYKCDIDSAAERAEHLEILNRCLRLAKAFDCPVVRTFMFWRKGDPAARWKELVAAYAEPAELAAKAGVILGMENESACMLGTGEEVGRLVRDIGHPNVRVAWDCANAFDAGEVPYPDGYEHVKDLLCHVHLKDARVNPDTRKIENYIVGEGDIDLAGEFRALVRDGYTAFVSLETHWRPKSLGEDLLNRPGGAAFSLNAETASRICLQNWRRILNDLNLEAK